jgi:hypothetical protein
MPFNVSDWAIPARKGACISYAIDGVTLMREAPDDESEVILAMEVGMKVTYNFIASVDSEGRHWLQVFYHSMRPEDAGCNYVGYLRADLFFVNPSYSVNMLSRRV